MNPLSDPLFLAMAAGSAADGGSAGYRYWRFDQLTQSSASALEVGEFALVNDGVYVSGNEWFNDGLMFGKATGLFSTPAFTDGVLTARVFQIVTPASSAYIQYDHGSPVVCTGWKYASFFRPATRYITGVRVRGSNDGTTFEDVATFSGMTAYTANNANSVNQLSPEYTFD